MDHVIGEDQNLAEVTRIEVQRYAGNAHKAKLYPIFDDTRQSYTIIEVPDDKSQRPAEVVMMARVEGDYIIIEEDTAFDKPLYEALMVNGNIPREQIILAYKGETIPEKANNT